MGMEERGGDAAAHAPPESKLPEKAMPTDLGSPVAAAPQPVSDKAEEQKTASESASAEPTPATDAPVADDPGETDASTEKPSPKPSEEETETGTDGVPNGEGVGGDGGGKGIGHDNSAGAAITKGEVGDGAVGEEEDLTVCITVHPPQKSGAAPVVLEPLAGVELVLQVRQMLSELPHTCLYSAFRLVAVAPSGEDGKEDVWAGEGEEMNEYVELRSIPAVVARPEKAQARMELVAYNSHSARQHVQKFRELLRYPPACAEGMGPGAKTGNGKKQKGKNKKQKEASASAGARVPASPGVSLAETTTSPSDASLPLADSAAEDMAQRVQRALDIRGRLKDSRVPVGGEGLGSFYGVGLGLAVDEVAHPSKEEAAATSGKGGDKDKDAPITCLRGVAVSAWNPPPPQQRMVGDLMYLEVTALDGTVIHVTCTQGGFYVNATRRDNFDPKPVANNPCHSHELATCLLAYNPSFAKAWNNAVTQAWKRSQSDDPVHALARAMREGRGDAVMVKPQWNVPVLDPKWAVHKADPSRAQEDLSNGFGIEDRCIPREWNDEYQCLLELPTDTPDLSMTRSRALHKLLCDFQEAATAGALAIADGHISPANPIEAEQSHVFVFNNMFFSYAADSLDAYKAVKGEAAARKAASQDLASVVALNNLSEALHPQLGIKTLATAVIDYAGRRLIAQSLVPGILNGDQANKVVYGAMEHGQRLRENPKIGSLLREVGERLMIAEREVEAVPIKKRDPAGDLASRESSNKDGVLKEGTGDENGEEHKDTVKITGAVEMKGIIGSDGRSYLLDVSRLSPRDANWVHGEKGTGVYDEWVKVHGDKPPPLATWERECGGEPDLSFEDMAVLRQSLLNMFTRHKMGEWLRGKDDEALDRKKTADSGDVASDKAGGEIVANASEADKAESSDEPTSETEVSSVVKKAETAVASGEDVGVNGSAEVPKGREGESVALEEVKGVVEELGEGGVGGDGSGKRSLAMLSDQEVEKLRDEQDAKCKELEINVNVFMPYKGCVDEKQLSADEALAREAARYLWDVALPYVNMEVKRGTICPLDCAELATVLHGAGVNMRYMGRLATLAVAEEAEDATVRTEGKIRRWQMPLFWLEMLETEMVARAATHVFTRYMGACTPRSRAAPGYAIQQFLNCLLGGSGKGDGKMVATANGSSTSTSPRAVTAAVVTAAATSPTIPVESTWMQEDGEVVALTHEGLWQSISAEVAVRFRHKLTTWGRKATAASSKNRAHKLPLLRRLCQRLGLRVLSRKYDMDKHEPFSLEDMIGTFPVVKSCVPASPAPEAAETLDMAQVHLSSGAGLQAAHDLAHHAATMLLQACDGMHSKYPMALNLQARVMYHVGDADSAVALQLKALAYFEQLEGLDSSAVLKCHEHLGHYYMLAGLYDRALAHMRAFCYLLELTAGPNHPDLANGYHRMGKAYQDVGCGMMALRCYQEVLERQAGDHMINPRVHHNVAETLEAMRGYTDALKHERLSYAGYKAFHGDQHPMVAKSTENIRALTTKIVKVAQERTAQSGTASISAQHRSASAAGAPEAGGGGVVAAGSAKPSRANGSAAALSTSDDGARSAPAAESEEGRADGGTGGGEPGGVEGDKGNGPPSKAAAEGRGEGVGGGKQGSPSRGGVSNGSKSLSKKKGRR